MKKGRIIKYYEETMYGDIKRYHKVDEYDIEAYKLYKNNKNILTHIEFDIFVSSHDVDSFWHKEYYEKVSSIIRCNKLEEIEQNS